MNIHPEFIQPIQDMFGRLIRGEREDIFVDYKSEEGIQFIDEILRLYPYNQPPYHFIDIPYEEFIDNDDLSTFLRRGEDGQFGELSEYGFPLRYDIDSVWEVEGIHPWTEEEGRAVDLCATVNVYVSKNRSIVAKLIDIHE